MCDHEPIVCSRSVVCGFITEVCVTMECINICVDAKLAALQSLYYTIGTCTAASLPQESVCSEAVLLCVLAMYGKGRRKHCQSNHLYI